MNAEELYVSLARLIESPPDFDTRPVPAETLLWLGRAYALSVEAGQVSSAANLSVLSNRLPTLRGSVISAQVFVELYRVLAVAETKAPAAARGAFINAGNSFDAMMAVGKVVSTAQRVIRIVDPYMDEKALTDFSILAKDGIAVELLSDAATVKASLAPAVRSYSQQYGSKRPLDARLAAARSLHDRLIVVDGSTVWTLTQSLNAFAARSPATIVRIDGDSSPLKIAAYDAFWAGAVPII